MPRTPETSADRFFLNHQRYEEAAQHTLDALLLQDSDSVRDPGDDSSGRGVTSDTLWDSLKTCCLHMQRLDLATLCDRRDLEGASCARFRSSARRPAAGRWRENLHRRLCPDTRADGRVVFVDITNSILP